MIRFTSAFEVVVRCRECGNELGATMQQYKTGCGPIIVRPCRACMQDERQRGFDEGYDSRAEEED